MPHSESLTVRTTNESKGKFPFKRRENWKKTRSSRQVINGNMREEQERENVGAFLGETQGI